VDIDLDYIQKSLGDEYIIVYKPHPLINATRYSGNNHIINMQHESIKKVFTVTDVMISDYSAIIFDYLTIRKPIIAYVPDLEEYAQMPGLFIDYEKEFPGPIVNSNQALIEAIRNASYDEDKQTRLYDKVFCYKDGNARHRVVQLIETIMEEVA
jgi:CDP-ribitol ribitolphosphotransferase